MMRDFEPLPPDVPRNLQNVIAKALAKQPENRYASAAEMREDLRRVLRGEAVSDFIQSDSRQNFSTSEIPTTQKVAPNFAQNFQDENETVIRSAPSFGQSENRKSSNVWMYATLALVLVGAIGFGVYFIANQSKQNDSDKNEVSQSTETKSNNLEKSESINAVTNTNSPTPLPTQALDIRKINFKKLVFPLSKNEREAELTQKDRTVEKVVFGDLNNDGVDEAVVLVLWSFASFGGNGYWYSVYVYDIEVNSLKNIARIDGGSKNGNEEISNMNIQNSSLITQWCVNYPNNSYDRFSETRIYKMNSGKISLVSKSKGNSSC